MLIPSLFFFPHSFFCSPHLRPLLLFGSPLPLRLFLIVFLLLTAAFSALSYIYHFIPHSLYYPLTSFVACNDPTTHIFHLSVFMRTLHWVPFLCHCFLHPNPDHYPKANHNLYMANPKTNLNLIHTLVLNINRNPKTSTIFYGINVDHHNILFFHFKNWAYNIRIAKTHIPFLK